MPSTVFGPFRPSQRHYDDKQQIKQTVDAREVAKKMCYSYFFGHLKAVGTLDHSHERLFRSILGPGCTAKLISHLSIGIWLGPGTGVARSQFGSGLSQTLHKTHYN
jgi:hypothetical protein